MLGGGYVMSIIYKRMISIIEDITERHLVELSVLAKKNKVSKQTLKNDINNINELLITNHLQQLSLVDDIIINIVDLVEVKKFINDYITNNLYAYKLSKSELVVFLTLLLILSDDYITINDVAEKLNISRSTLLNNLPQCKFYIKNLGLSLKSSSNKGIMILSNELDRREAMITVLKQQLRDNRFILNLAAKSSIFFEEDKRPILRNIINDLKKINIELSETSYQILEYYLLFCIPRFQKMHFIKSVKLNKESEYFQIISDQLLGQISKALNIENIPQEEGNFLSNLCNKELIIRAPWLNYQQALYIQFIVRKIINDVSNSLMIDLTDSFSLEKNLTAHLVSIYKYPLQSENIPSNDLVDIDEYLVSVVKENITPIEVYFKRKLSDVELWYISLHFGAAIRQNQIEKITYKVILISNERKSKIEYTYSKLEQINNINVSKIINSHEISTIYEKDVDFLISTEALATSPVEVIYISSNVNSEDLIKISAKIEDLMNNGIEPVQKNNKIDQFMDNVRSLICSDTNLTTEYVLQRIEECAKNTFLQKKANKLFEEKTLYLHQLLLPSLMNFDVLVNDWIDAIYKSSNKMVNQGYFNQQYVQSIINQTYEYGPYYIIAPKIAILHAEPERSCFKTGISFTRLLNPVNFLNNAQYPVQYLFVFSITDNELHIKALFQLQNLLESSKFQGMLRQVKTAEELYMYIIDNEGF